jgi:hypothetical protein
VGKENIFQPTNGNVSLNQESNDYDDVRIINIVTIKNINVKNTLYGTETFTSTSVPLLIDR